MDPEKVGLSRDKLSKFPPRCLLLNRFWFVHRSSAKRGDTDRVPSRAITGNLPAKPNTAQPPGPVWHETVAAANLYESLRNTDDQSWTDTHTLTKQYFKFYHI
jgi:hypothetical protein